MDYWQKLQTFLDRSGYENVSINGVPLHINPDTFEMQTSVTYSEAPTLGGAGVFMFKPTFPKIVMDGMTGTAGLDELNRLAAVRPLPGRQGAPFRFSFPARGIRNMFVVCTAFNDTVKPEAFLYNFYHIELIDASFLNQFYATQLSQSMLSSVGLPVR